MTTPAHLILSRTSPTDIQQRPVFLSLDGQPLSKLLYGDSFAQDVPAGIHTLQANNTFHTKTITFSLAPGEQAQFHVINRAGRFTWFLLSLLGAGPLYVSIERER